MNRSKSQNVGHVTVQANEDGGDYRYGKCPDCGSRVDASKGDTFGTCHSCFGIFEVTDVTPATIPAAT